MTSTIVSVETRDYAIAQLHRDIAYHQQQVSKLKAVCNPAIGASPGQRRLGARIAHHKKKIKHYEAKIAKHRTRDVR